MYPFQKTGSLANTVYSPGWKGVLLALAMSVPGAIVLGAGLTPSAALDSLPRPATVSGDSLPVNTLSEVVIRAFEQNGKLSDQPAPVAYISRASLSRYGNQRPLSALNAVPGVRMEARSPGSYRLNIRGSSLRSPFGVRNVKVYYNGIPFTDPGGNTYLNQLSYSDYGSIEVIKGPAGSLYGAGTGGAVLIQSPLALDQGPNQAELTLEGGSFGERQLNTRVSWGNDTQASELRYTHYQSDGYRDHTANRSDIASYELRLKSGERQTLSAFFHFTDLYYDTPGALTLAEYTHTPRASRPASGPYPSSDSSHAAVYQTAFFTGLKSDYLISGQVRNTTVLYGSYTDFTNPTTRNYEYRKEPHFGGRTVFDFHWKKGSVGKRLWLGAEAQQGFFQVQDLGNRAGKPDTMQTEYRINDFTGLLFAQGALSFGHGWDLSAGLSMYHEHIRFTSLYPAPIDFFHKKYHEVLSPRIALSKKITPAILVYANLSDGFSPPSVSEVLPSTNILNTSLEAEKGVNYELGSKGSIFNGRLYYEGSVFLFRLHQTITVRRDASGADYFVNAGSALEKGAELSVSEVLYQAPHRFLTRAEFWAAGSYLDFRYRHFLSEGEDYSGHRIPGSAPLTLSGGLDLATRIGLAWHLTWQHTNRIALDDANSQYAGSYDLVGARVSWEKNLGLRTRLTLSVSGDNLLNQRYSLGNDINAVGGRFYNAAPGANVAVSAGLAFQLEKND